MHTLKGGRIDGVKIDEFLDGFEDSILYLIDVDSYLGGEMNFRVYAELSGLFPLWIDAAPRRQYDIMDILVGGGDYAVAHEHFIPEAELREILQLTENVILKSFEPLFIAKFLSWGGRKVLTSEKLAPAAGPEAYVMRGGEICPWRS